MKILVIFTLVFTLLNASNIQKKTDDELRIMLQVFLYKGDLKNAYKVATIGYNRDKKSYYWNQKLAEISKWTNRTARSMKHLRFLYDTKYDKKLEAELITYGLEEYQYEQIEELVISRATNNPTKRNIDLMINIFKKIGYPEKVIAVLEQQYEKDTTNKMFIRKALRLSLEIGNMDLAKKYVRIFEMNQPYSREDASLIARYYYIGKNISQAYNSLFVVDEELEEDERYIYKYYQLRSDLGWYMQDNLNAASASIKLIEFKEGRLVDYERAIFVYKEDEVKKSAYYARKAFIKYKLSSLFYTYANSELQGNDLQDLYKIIEKIDKSNHDLKNDLIYWIIKSKVYKHFHKYEKEKEALDHALMLNPNDYNTKLILLSHYISVDNRKKVKVVLQDMSENQSLGFNFYLPMASAYYYLGDINRASLYTRKLIDADNPIIEFISFKFMQAYIYQSQNNTEAFSSYMLDIVDTLEMKEKKNPGLKKQDLHLSNYLRAAMHVLSAKTFEKKLKNAKNYLTEKNYKDISYSWAIINNADEKSLKIYHSLKSKELWLIFSNNMLFQNHTGVENILESYLGSVSIGDASRSAYKDGQISLSQSIAFEGFLQNEKSQNIYLQHLDLSQKRSDVMDIKTTYKTQLPLIQKKVDIKNEIYLDRAYNFFTEINYINNVLENTNAYKNIPKEMLKASIGVRKRYDRGHFQVNLNYYNFLEKYFGYSFLLKHQLSTDLLGGISIGKNKNATEGIPLFIGGKKDNIILDLSWGILNSVSVNFLYEYDKLYSQDDVYLGKGEHSRVDISHKIRNGYPNMKIAGFYEIGDYSETSGSRGIIDSIQKKLYSVLPGKYYNFGINFSYGMMNYDQYTRVWRLYFDTSLYYSSIPEDYSYSMHAGYGGRVWHQDHLSTGFLYTDSVAGVGGESYEIYLKYKFMYRHP